jgi:hypothetical protein
MKNLNNSLFQKFENNKIDDLTKVIAGKPTGSFWINGDNCGCDTIDTSTSYGDIISLNNKVGRFDFLVVPCKAVSDTTAPRLA